MKTALIALAGIIFAGCTVPPQPPTPRDIERSAVIPAGMQPTWNAVIDVFGERLWAIDNMEMASGLITTDWMSVGEQDALEYMDCGIATRYGNMPEEPIVGDQVRFNIVVRDATDGTTVTVNALMRALSDIDASVRDCVSTGLLEREIHEQVAGRVTQGR